MKEEWKVWKDTRKYNKYGNIFNGCLWEVSNLGRVKKNGEILSFVEGNYYIQLSGGKYLHKIIAELFIPNPDNKKEIDHIDGNKLNNRVDNLRWVTHIENMNNPRIKEMHPNQYNFLNPEFRKILIEHRRSYKGNGNPMYGKKKRREYNEDGTYHYIFD